MDDNTKLRTSLILYSIALVVIATFAGSYSSNLPSSEVMSIWTVILILFFIATSRKSSTQSYLFGASILCSVAFLFTYLTSWTSALNLSWVVLYPIPFIVMLLIVLFFVELYLTIKIRHRWLFLVMAAIAAILYFSVYASSYLVSDETVLSYYAYHAFLSGANPYSMNVAANLTHLHSALGVVVTYYRNGTVVSAFKYPALYFLVQAPFYLLLNPTPYTLSTNFSADEAIIFFFIFLLAYICVSKQANRPASPSYAAIMLFALLGLTQLIFLLMIPLILFMYSKFGQKYKWLILGIMVSLQEQLWFIALLFLFYEFRTNLNKGIRTMLGAGLVFLLINGYFIALNPSAFISAFTSETSYLQPNSIAVFSHILLELGISPSTIAAVFLVSILASILLSLWLNDYKIIPLISIIPFLFLSHAGVAYYLIPFTAFAFVDNLLSMQKSSRTI